MPTLNELLESAYGDTTEITPFGTSRRRIAQQTPYETADLPNAKYLEELFAQNAQKVSLEGEPGIGQTVWHGVEHLINALSAGEYAIASMLQNSARRAKGLSGDSAWDSFMNGLKAGFNDDERFKVRMYDVLGEWGWNPDTTAGNIGKHVVGFLSGMLVDPLTYVGFGPLAKSYRGFVGSETMKSIIKEMGIEGTTRTIKRLSGGQYLNALGQKLRKRITSLHETADKAAGESIGIWSEAGVRGNKDAIKALMPMEGAPLEQVLRSKIVTIGSDEVDLVKEGLNVLGREATEQNKKWFVEEGFKKFFDPGGIKIGIPFTSFEGNLWKKGVIGPRTSGIVGLVIGEHLTKNMPVSVSMGNKILESDFYKNTVGKTVEAFNKYFRSKEGLTDEQIAFVSHLKGTLDAMRPLSAASANGVASTDAEIITRRIGKSEFPTLTSKSDEFGIARIKPKSPEDELLAQIGFDMTSLEPLREQIKSGSSPSEVLSRMVAKGGHKETIDHFNKLGIEMSDEEIKKLGKVLDNSYSHFASINKLLIDNGFELDDLESYVLPFIAGEKTLHSYINATGAKTYSEIKEATRNLEKVTLGKSWTELMNTPLGVGGKNIAAHPETSFINAVRRRTYNSFKDVSIREVAEMHPSVFKGKVFGDEDLKAILHDPTLVNSFPQLSWELAAQAGKTAEGLKTARGIDPAEGFKDALQGLMRAKDADAVLDKLLKSLDTIENADVQNIGKIAGMYDEAIEFWKIQEYNAAKTGHQAHAQEIVETLERLRTPFLEDANRRTATRQLEKAIIDGSKYSEKINELRYRIEDAKQTIKTMGNGKFGNQLPNILSSVGITKDPSTVTESAIRRLEALINTPKELERVWRAAIDKDKVLTKAFNEEAKRLKQEAKEEINTLTELSAEEKKKQIKELFDQKVKDIDMNALEAKAVEEELFKTTTAFREKYGFVGRERNRKIDDLLAKHAEENFVSLDGFKGIKIRDPVQKDKFVSMDRFVVSRPFFEALANIVDPIEVIKGKGGPLLRTFNFAFENMKRLITGTFVPGVLRPAYFARNILDNFLRRIAEPAIGIDGWTEKGFDYTKAIWDILRGKNLNDTVQLAGNKYTKSELRDFLEQSGYFRFRQERIGSRAGEIDSFGDLLGMVSARAGKAWTDVVDRTRKLWYKGVGGKYFSPDNAAYFVDNYPIAESFLQLIDSGIPVAQAMRRISRSMFDFNNLTPFEKQLSSIIMFYNYQRQAIPFALEQLSRRPLWFNASTRLSDLAFDDTEEKALVPKWVRNYPLIRLQKENGKLKFTSFRNMFSVDVLGDLNPINAYEWLSKVNPIIMAPIEFAIGRDIYIKEDILPVKYLTQEVSGVTKSEFSPFAKWLNAHQVHAANGIDYTAVDGWRWFALRRLFFSRIYRDLEQVGKTIEGKDDAWQALMHFGLGLKIVEYDMEKQRDFLERDANKAKSAYNDAIKRGDRQRAIEILREITL